MTSPILTSSDLPSLDAAFAEIVCGWTPMGVEAESRESVWSDGSKYVQFARFTQDANAVLPHVKAFLDKAIFSKRKEFWDHLARLAITGRKDWVAAYPDCLGLLICYSELPKALVIALLKAHGATVSDE